MMNTIYGIPVAADLELPYSEKEKIVKELMTEWAWNGRQLGKVEIISDEQFIHVCAYEKPIVKVYKEIIKKY
ncbi:Hypothetical protein LUCI_1361 [Lucifera butyrica]|uniref:Uncharacterized protein n=2 Tax=Lucifera butyrica TaxID=1351585 RepID=A0A498R0T1_9FIRM|nr:Hypothetical protein LUCI_1361 [Lucifera butyrica]